MLRENSVKETPEFIAQEAENFVRKFIPNKPEDFYRHINVWTEWIFLTDNIIDENNIKTSVGLKEIILDDLTIIDMHKLFRKYITSPETEEHLKTKLFELNSNDISLYKLIIKNDIKHDYTSRIIVFFYIILPILQDILNTEMICLIAIMTTLLDDLEDGDNEIPFDVYQIMECVLEEFEKDNSLQVNNSITVKIKTALIYLILFSLKRTEGGPDRAGGPDNTRGPDNKITFSMLFTYLHLIV
jgi:hypothetical protein